MDNKDTSDVSTYYDKFNLDRKGTYRNLRHYKIINMLFKEGLNSKSNVLEIGCGSGPISEVVANFTKRGYFLGMDISKESVQSLNAKFSKSDNVQFIASDLADFNIDKKFDLVILADVLEHIPIEIHEEVFEKLKNYTTENGKLVINIPSFEFITWQKSNDSENLQIIDQALPSSHVLSVAFKYGFVPKIVSKHKLFQTTNDYEFFILEKENKEIKFKKRSQYHIILDKLRYRSLVFIKKIIK